MRGRFSWFNATSIAFGFAFLYIPIMLLVIYSFNESRLVTVWAGFSTKWYGSLLENQALKDQLARWYVEAYWARRKERGFAGPEDIPKHDSSGQAALHFSTSPDNYARAPILLFVIAEQMGVDVSAACQNLMLAARALGIGSTITSIGGIHERNVHRLLGIPGQLLRGTFGVSQGFGCPLLELGRCRLESFLRAGFGLS